MFYYNEEVENGLSNCKNSWSKNIVFCLSVFLRFIHIESYSSGSLIFTAVRYFILWTFYNLFTQSPVY